MPETRATPSLTGLRDRYSEIYTIVSPPRCSSTAFARVFWEHPEIRFYSHEPFEVTYYMGRGLGEVADKLASPLDLRELKCYRSGSVGGCLVLKEMPYQVGESFPLLVELATKPLIFLIRDPRLSIASRMAKKREVGDDPFFPAIESGWELLRRQIEWCRSEGVPHVLVRSRDFRNRPLEIFPQIFARFGLSFTPEMLEWQACSDVDLDNLGGRHRHLYGEVLGSTRIKPDSDEIPPLESFPEPGGWRAHVAQCLETYLELAGAAERIRPLGAAGLP